MQMNHVFKVCPLIYGLKVDIHSLVCSKTDFETFVQSCHSLVKMRTLGTFVAFRTSEIR
jgi:hypothetical protein